jgi:hypothetical protein
MKSPLKLWLLKKLRSRQRSSHGDPQKLKHVKEALRHDVVTSEHLGRLPTLNTEDLVALSVMPSPNRQNEAPSATVARMSENLTADAEDAFKDSQRIQTSSKADASSFYTEASTRIDQSSTSDGSPHDIKDLEIIPPSSPLHGSPLSGKDLKRSDSPILIRKFSPDGHMSILLDLRQDSQAEAERLDHPDSLSGEQDHLFYDGIYRPESILENSDHSESILGGEDRPEPKLDWPHHPELNLDQQAYPEPFWEGQSHSQSISDKPPHEVLVPNRPYHSDFFLERSHPESVILGAQDRSEPTSRGPDHLEPISDQLDYPEPLWESEDYPWHNSDQQDHPEPIPERPDHPAPISVRPDLSELISEGEFHTKPVSAGHDQVELISEGQSRPQSIRSHKSLMVKDQQRRFRREAKLHYLLSRNLQTRAHAYEKRSQLRQSRSKISDADQQFMKLIRERRVQGSQDDLALVASFEKLQDTRDKYGPLEEIYNAIEDQLNREEYEAKELENKILKSEIPGPDIDIDSRSSSSSDSKAPEIIREPDHPLYEEYMSRLGDADLCYEALSDLRMENEGLLHTQEVRRTVGIELSPDDQATLEIFPAAEAKLLDELRRIEADVEHLRLECDRLGLFGENKHEFMDEDEVIDLWQHSIGSGDPKQPEYNKYSLLLEKPEEKEDEGKSKVLLTDFKEGDVGDRVTCWLLHKLRSSGLEAELLARVSDELHRSAKTEKWQEEVLDFWFFDSTNLPTSAYKIEPTLTAFPPSPLTDLNKGSYGRFGDAQLIQLVIRSSSQSQKLEFGRWLKLTRMKGRSAVTMK